MYKFTNISYSSLSNNIEYISLLSLNLVFENLRITVKRAVTQEDSHKIFVHAESQDTMYGIVNLEDTTNVKPLDVVTQDKNLHLSTFHIMV